MILVRRRPSRTCFDSFIKGIEAVDDAKLKDKSVISRKIFRVLKQHVQNGAEIETK